jgi:hypothetical protein
MPARPFSPSHQPWNEGLLVGQKKPLEPKHVWSIRVRLELALSKRDLAIFIWQSTANFALVTWSRYAAAFLEALNSPPGNRLEALKGDLAGKHSIRINDQWRIVFRWTDAGPEDVEIIDYH